jgi:hypothetical protein
MADFTPMLLKLGSKAIARMRRGAPKRPVRKSAARFSRSAGGGAIRFTPGVGSSVG